MKMERVEFGYVLEGRVHGLPMVSSRVSIAWDDVYSGMVESGPILWCLVKGGRT